MSETPDNDSQQQVQEAGVPSEETGVEESVLLVEQTQHWSGPLPSPESLRQFNEVIPDGANRIVSAWEAETAHRHTMEKSELKLAWTEVLVGKISGLVFVLVALGVSAYCAAIGAHTVASILGGGVIGSVVWALVKTRSDKPPQS